MCETPDRPCQTGPDEGLHSGREPPHGAADTPADNPSDTPADPSEIASADGPTVSEQPTPKKKNKVRRRALRLLLKLGLVFLAGWFALTFVFGVHRVSGNDMYPALRDGDLCITYKIGASYAGDTVAYKTPDGIRMGRVVAREGDTVDGDEKGLILNGAPPAEEIFYPTQMLDTALTLPVRLEKGEYLILNDYRSNLHDSRTYGIISQSALDGKVIFLFRRRGF